MLRFNTIVQCIVVSVLLGVLPTAVNAQTTFNTSGNYTLEWEGGGFPLFAAFREYRNVKMISGQVPKPGSPGQWGMFPISYIWDFKVVTKK